MFRKAADLHAAQLRLKEELSRLQEASAKMEGQQQVPLEEVLSGLEVKPHH